MSREKELPAEASLSATKGDKRRCCRRRRRRRETVVRDACAPCVQLRSEIYTRCNIDDDNLVKWTSLRACGHIADCCSVGGIVLPTPDVCEMEGVLRSKRIHYSDDVYARSRSVLRVRFARA